ncbi:hypothetical protein SEA_VALENTINIPUFF_69 [Microbacterium phage ValentiniPuff]|uniref:Uncharacterized protein n=1 Tax=Microbacterium phage ValentiniPuff TaxID=2315705 RepID=A0A386KQT1_9CAUD|nr:hypothetical protein SEA_VALENTINIPUFF_69 [Microbacterium phage ValentiniPuff]
MVTIATGLAINSDVQAERTTPDSMRHIFGTLFAQTTAGEPVVGRIPAPSAPLVVTGHASLMQYLVTKGYAVTTRAGKGAYIVGTPIDLVVPAAAAHATLPRIDRIYIVQPDPELTEAGLARIDVVTGTPATTPTVPVLPAGALELSRKLIAPGATNTKDGAAFTDVPALTKLNMGAVLAAMIEDQQNINAGRVNGVKVTSSNTGVAPAGPAIGDVWVDWS